VSGADRAEAALGQLTAALPAGERREQQVAMARAVAEAIGRKRHLVVQAGTGTGKSLAYLVPAVLSGQRVVVATATKALQDQLAHKDLPFLAEHLDRPFSFAVLKGRSNYLCLQRLHELTSGADQLALEGLDRRLPEAELGRIEAWAETAETGDRADLAVEPSPAAWAALSVGPRECPGAAHCPKGEVCFAERARNRAAAADVVVVNTHLYGLHLASDGGLLPEHELVVIDEAHQLEDTISATAGVELTPGRLRSLAHAVGAIVADDELLDGLESSADKLKQALAEDLGRRLRTTLDPVLADALALARSRAERALSAVRAVPAADDDEGSVATRKLRATKVVGSLIDDLDVVLAVPAGSVGWIEGTPDQPRLRVAPIEVGDVLGPALWERTTAVLTSATLAPALPERLGLDEGAYRRIDVGSPFDYPSQALLYCAAHLPDPRHATYDDALHDELAGLIEAAGGRTLALFTSYRAMHAARDALAGRIGVPLLAQDDLPKAALVATFAADEATCLFATMGFWQGIDVPGRSLSLVTIDRLPFPRPDEPLLQARRERARADAFRVVDLPRAVTLLAQGAGRLIRTRTDRGVVAVLDPRMATNQRYRWDVVNALPPMRRTRDGAEARKLLAEIRDGADSPADQ
jgi:ATP-dependent DNA helicase DinG